MKQAVSYGRISVATKESVSIDRQHEANAKYAGAVLGLPVVGEYTDEGVSATSLFRPGDRKGWSAMLAALEPGTVVVVWSVDRMARNIVGFWEAYQDLAARGCSLALSKDNLDLTSPLGKVVLSLLVAFAEMESTMTADRSRAARATVLSAGRAVGGNVVYGYDRVRNPDGEGWVWVQDPEQIEVVKAIVSRVQRGDSLHSVRLWLNEQGVPSPKRAWAERRAGEKTRAGKVIDPEDHTPTWESWTTLSRIVRHPFLFGGVPHSPGNKTRVRGEGLLRDEAGRLAVLDRLAVMTHDQWLDMVRRLDEDDKPQNRPASERAKTSPLLAGLVYCGRCGGFDTQTRMHRGTVNGRPGATCPKCRGAISNYEDVVIEEALRVWGGSERMHRVMASSGGGMAESAYLAEQISHLRTLQDAGDDAEYDRLEKEIRALRKRKQAADAEKPVVSWTWEGTGQTYRQAWDAAETVEEQQSVLRDIIDRVIVKPGKKGRRPKDGSGVRERLLFEWTYDPE